MFFSNFLHLCIFLWWFYLYTISHQSRAFIQIFYIFLLHLHTTWTKWHPVSLCCCGFSRKRMTYSVLTEATAKPSYTHKFFLSKSQRLVTPMNDFSVPTSTTSVVDMASPSHLSHASPVPLSISAPHDRCFVLPRPQLPGPAFVLSVALC